MHLVTQFQSRLQQTFRYVGFMHEVHQESMEFSSFVPVRSDKVILLMWIGIQVVEFR